MCSFLFVSMYFSFSFGLKNKLKALSVKVCFFKCTSSDFVIQLETLLIDSLWVQIVKIIAVGLLLTSCRRDNSTH